MDENKLISIIVPVYNIEAYLPRCLDTLVCQTYQNIEIILVDDGSTDKSGAICDEFANKDSRVFVIHQTNMKLWAARNSGLRIAHGDYIMFVDGDDYIHLQLLELLYIAINQNQGYDLAIANCVGTNSLDENTSKFLTEIRYEELSRKQLLSNMPSFQIIQVKLYKKELLENTYFREYEYGEDYDFITRVFLKTNKAIWLHHCLYYYFQRESSAMHQPNAQLMGREWQLKALQKIIDELPEEKEEYRQYLYRELYINMLIAINLARNTKDEKRIRLLCMSYEQKSRKHYWRNKDISLLEKTRMTFNVRFPELVNFFKPIKRIL